MRSLSVKTNEKAQALVCLVGIAVLATLVRCLHLLDSNHYYIISPDSYFFHWQAARALAGQDALPMTWHGGLTYPLAWTASVIAQITGMAPSEALTLAGKLLPPALGIISMLVMYLAASKMYNWRAGIGAAFAWSVLADAYFIHAAGYLDRDGLNVLLFASGVFVFYFSRKWHFTVMHRDVGWVAGALALMLIEALLMLEWLWVGAALLLTVLASYVVLDVFLDILPYLSSVSGGRDISNFALRRMGRHILASIGRSNWRPLALVMGANVVIGLFYPGLSEIGNLSAFGMGGNSGVAELGPLGPNDVLRWGLLIVPLVIGLYIALARRRKGDSLCLAWFLSLFGLALFSNRILLLVAPATCLIAGIGLAWFLDLKNASRSPTVLGAGAQVFTLPSRYVMKLCAAGVLVVILVLGSPRAAYQLASNDRMAVNSEWQAALSYIRYETPEDAVVLSWWDYGYWILDMGDRTPVVDNGLYNYDEKRLDAVGLAYCTSDPAVAAQVMKYYHAGYFVFSRLEGTLPHIPQYGLRDEHGDDEVILDDLEDSLYYQALNGGFESGGGLKRVWPAPEVKHPGVIILAVD